MDEPLFGERSQKTTVFTFIVGGVVSVFVLFCVIISIVYGLKEKEHFVIAFALICNYVVLAILYKWYRVAVNVYVWKKPPSPPPPIQCAGLYRISDGACFPACAVAGYCLDSTLGQCVQIPQCNTTTTGATTGSMFYQM